MRVSGEWRGQAAMNTTTKKLAGETERATEEERERGERGGQREKEEGRCGDGGDREEEEVWRMKRRRREKMADDGGETGDFGWTGNKESVGGRAAEAAAVVHGAMQESSCTR